MGYDMSFVKSGDNDYFRLNIWGMGRYITLMRELGMVYASSSPGGWPEWKRYPDDEGRQGQFESAQEHLKYGEALEESIPDDVMQAARDHVAAEDEILRHHPAGGRVIPSHKFSSNDGWVVTPDEITAALAVLDARTDTDEIAAYHTEDLDYWHDWISYLRRAVDAGGFEVH
jgi:hypothetical protein